MTSFSSVNILDQKSIVEGKQSEEFAKAGMDIKG
jgi:hypothetical protein